MMLNRKLYYLLDDKVQSLIPLALDVTNTVSLSVPKVPRQLLLGPSAVKVTDPNSGSSIEALFIIKNFSQGVSKIIGEQIPFVYAISRGKSVFLQLSDLDFISNFSSLLFDENGEPSQQFDRIAQDLIGHEELFSVSTNWYRRVNSVNPSPFDLCVDQMAEFTHLTFSSDNINPQIQWLLNYLPSEGKAMLSSSLNYANLAKLSRALRNDAYTHFNRESLALSLRTTQPGMVYPWLQSSVDSSQLTSKQQLLFHFPALAISSIDPAHMNETIPEFTTLNDMSDYLSEKLSIKKSVVEKLANYTDFDHRRPFADLGKIQIINSFEIHKLPQTPSQWEHFLLFIEQIDSLAANFYRLNKFDMPAWVKTLVSNYMETIDGGPPDYESINREVRLQIQERNGSFLDIAYASTRLNTMAPNALVVPYIESLIKQPLDVQLTFVGMINKAHRKIVEENQKPHLLVNSPFPSFQHAHFLFIPTASKDGFNFKYQALNFSNYCQSEICATVNLQGMITWSSMETIDPEISIALEHLNSHYSVFKNHDVHFQKIHVLELSSSHLQDNSIQRPQWLDSWMTTVGATNFDEAIDATAVVSRSVMHSAFKKIKYRLGI